MSPETYVTEFLEWRGRRIEIRYAADWLGRGEAGSEFAVAHLEVRCVEPKRTPLPVTETGYRSHFIPQGTVEDAGGPAAYTAAWLEYEAKGKSWGSIEARFNQLDLFAE